MIIGIPKEIKDNEYRVALTPGGAEAFIMAGHQVSVQVSAGEGSGFADAEYTAAGAEVVPSAAEVWERAEMIMKVKEPRPEEFDLMRSEQLLFTYLHLAAEEELTHALMERRVSAVAYETVESKRGALPLLTPMSEVAGRMSVQVAANYLQKAKGGRGKLLGGVAGVRRSTLTIIGGGVVGINAAQIALGMGAQTVILDIDADRLRFLDQVLHGNFNTLSSNPRNIADAVRVSDVVIGAVLVRGARAPRLVTQEMVRTMKPGAVIVDVAVDQGGCIETIKPTSHSDPTYEIEGVIHYGVTNMPGAVPRTSTYALSNATLPYGLRLANQGLKAAVESDAGLGMGVNVFNGRITYPAVAEAFGLKYTALSKVL
ncbi:MAG: alanine dehydrogenase [Anaerolineae bacterium]|nr:alanine dehydrogenase [Anaerolineae bacterium]MDK1119474.1 alanine dehydrogenase [Anaerolineae bacterium]